MTPLQFNQAVLNAFTKHFPNGYAKASKATLGSGAFYSFGLIGKKAECINGYRENDPMKLLLSVYDNFDFNSESDITCELVVEVQSKHLSCKPKHHYYAMSQERLPIRKMKGTPEKLIKTLDKAFAKIKAEVDAQVANNNLYKQDEINQKYL